jgi:hypothetical protein
MAQDHDRVTTRDRPTTAPEDVYETHVAPRLCTYCYTLVREPRERHTPASSLDQETRETASGKLIAVEQYHGPNRSGASRGHVPDRYAEPDRVDDGPTDCLATFCEMCGNEVGDRDPADTLPDHGPTLSRRRALGNVATIVDLLETLGFDVDEDTVRKTVRELKTDDERMNDDTAVFADAVAAGLKTGSHHNPTSKS